MKPACILGWYGSPNLGDEAELAAILGTLAAFPDPPPVTVFSVNPTQTRAAHGGYSGGIQVLSRNPCSRRAWQALGRSALLILGGGGLIQDQTSIYNLPIFTVFGLLARVRGCRLQWWGVGVEPLVTRFGRRQARALARWAAPGALSVRDAISRQILVGAGVPSRRVQVRADPALRLLPAAPDALSPLARGQTATNGPRVAFCVRDLPNNPRGAGPGYLLPMAAQKRLGLGGRGRTAHARRSAAFYALLARAADYLITEYGVQVVFVPFWPGRDDAVAAAVRGQMQRAGETTTATGVRHPADARALLAEMDLVVAVRLHALIFAAAAGVPGVGFSYARKIRGFMERAGQGDAVLDPQTATWPDVRSVLDRCWTARETRSGVIQGRVAELQRLAAVDAAVALRLLTG